MNLARRAKFSARCFSRTRISNGTIDALAKTCFALSPRPPPLSPPNRSQLCGQKTPDADHTAFRAMQETIVGEFPAGRILTPRQVRGDYETLTEAVNTASSFSKYAASSSSSPEEEEEEEVDGGVGADGSGSDGSAAEELKGGWPLVDDTRGMVLFIIDYQSTNILCRPAVRKVGKNAPSGTPTCSFVLHGSVVCSPPPQEPMERPSQGHLTYVCMYQ